MGRMNEQMNLLLRHFKRWSKNSHLWQFKVSEIVMVFSEAFGLKKKKSPKVIYHLLKAAQNNSSLFLACGN